MAVQQPDDLVNVDPDLTEAFLLAFVKYQLHPKMQMDRFNIVGILPVRIACSAHETQKISRLNHISFFEPRRKGSILLQVGIIVIAP